jgi:dihydrodipicolinate synthase/N-acetylneuraminate lyase
MLHGAVAASVTPLRDGGDALDEASIQPVVEFLAVGGMDGILALGTTGEGVMLSLEERKRAGEAFLAAGKGRLAVAIHCGAQTTADTASLTAHAAEHGADAVAVIAPPYFRFDETGLLAHFIEAARACAPVPFYVYEFVERSGYPIPVGVIQRLRDEAANLAGLKVSDSPFDLVEPYLIDGLDVFLGAEELILEGLGRGAAGAVSGLASAFPELVAAVVHERDEEASGQIATLDAALHRMPFHAAIKTILARRGVPIREDVRAPLRTLTEEERREVERILAEIEISV